MSHDTLLDLSRWQWALTAAMHITFPAVTVGTSVFLVVCYAMYMRTDDDATTILASHSPALLAACDRVITLGRSTSASSSTPPAAVMGSVA